MGRRIQLTPEWLALAASVYFAGLCNSRFWGEILSGRDPLSLSTLTFATSTFVLLTSVHLLLLGPLAFRRTTKPMLTFLFAANAVAIHFMTTYSVYLDRSMMRNILQTDVGEASDLLSWAMVPPFVLYGALPALVVWWVELRIDALAAVLRRKAIMAGASIACAGACVAVFYGDYTSFFQNAREARYLITPGNYLVSMTQAILETGADSAGTRVAVGEDAVRGPLLRASAKPVLFVFVVGETARAASFSLNGYARDTNPQLRGEDVVTFTQVHSCGTATAESLPCMFSVFGRNEVDDRDRRRYESLLDVMRRGGFRVIWRDNNSGCKGLCEGFETDNLVQAAIPDLCQDGECFDEVLLTGLDDRLTGDSDLFLVLHQKGSHGPAYSRRYPEQFERFRPACHSADLGDCTQAEILNAYDNTILYTDHVLHRVIELLEGQAGRYDTAMLYVSDHGESTGEMGLYLHGLPYSLAPDLQKHVPMILWMSPTFAERFRVDRACLEAQSGDQYSHDNLFHSVTGLLDIRTEVYRLDRDLFVPSRDRWELMALTEGRPDQVHSPG